MANDRQERETDPLINSRLTEDNQSQHSTQEFNLENVKPPMKVYSILHWIWALLFWIFMLVGGLHGLIMKGPVELARKKEEWMENGNLEWWGWLILAIIIIFFAYCEGYRGFQLAFSPMLVKRAYHFSSATSPVYQWSNVIYIDRSTDLLLAPLFAGGFICGTKRRLIGTWTVTIFVLALIVGVSYMSEETPWKCFIDIGVVIGLTWGFVFILVWWFNILLLNKWPEWIPDEYPDNLVVRSSDNVLVKNPSHFSSMA